jgi:hypothetical protein
MGIIERKETRMAKHPRLDYTDERDFKQQVLNIDLGEVIAFIADRCEPDEVFDDADLDAWALDNGWTKEE